MSIVESSYPKLVLVHVDSRETREVAIVNFYPPGWVVIRWGNCVGTFLIDTQQKSVINGEGMIKNIKTWRVADLEAARKVYTELAEAKKTKEPTRTFHSAFPSVSRTSNQN